MHTYLEFLGTNPLWITKDAIYNQGPFIPGGLKRKNFTRFFLDFSFNFLFLKIVLVLHSHSNILESLSRGYKSCNHQPVKDCSSIAYRALTMLVSLTDYFFLCRFVVPTVLSLLLSLFFPFRLGLVGLEREQLIIWGEVYLPRSSSGQRAEVAALPSCGPGVIASGWSLCFRKVYGTNIEILF